MRIARRREVERKIVIGREMFLTMTNATHVMT